MRKTYLKPSTEVITIRPCRLVCESPGSTIHTSVAGEGETPSGGWGSANVKTQGRHSIWNDDWSE